MGRVAAGRLNRRVRIERRAAGQDAWGQPIIGWVPVCTVWANVRVPTGASQIGAEYQAAGTEISRTSASIRVRKRAGIDHSMRAVLGDVIYDIRAVLPDEEGGEFMDLVCATGAREG